MIHFFKNRSISNFLKYQNDQWKSLKNTQIHGPKRIFSDIDNVIFRRKRYRSDLDYQLWFFENHKDVSLVEKYGEGAYSEPKLRAIVKKPMLLIVDPIEFFRRVQYKLTSFFENSFKPATNTNSN